MIKKANTNINYLKEKSDKLTRNISNREIEDSVSSLLHFKELMNLNALKIIEYIKYLDEEAISKIIKKVKELINEETDLSKNL